jgi:hypothetical protein
MGSPKKSQKETQQKLPQWFEDASQWNIDQGRQLAGREYTPYGYDRQAEFNPLQTDAFNSANFYGTMAPGAFAGGYNMLNDTSGQDMMGNAYGLMWGIVEQSGMLKADPSSVWTVMPTLTSSHRVSVIMSSRT